MHLLNAYFLSFRIFEQLALALRNSYPEIFHCFEMFFIIQEFWATFACPENRICFEIFQAGGQQRPPPPASYAYEPILYIAWKMTISKWHELALCPLNGLCLFG